MSEDKPVDIRHCAVCGTYVEWAYETYIDEHGLEHRAQYITPVSRYWQQPFSKYHPDNVTAVYCCVLCSVQAHKGNYDGNSKLP